MSEERPADSPSRRERRRGAPGLLFALTLIVLGGALLAGNLGLLRLNWAEAARYWPVLLILLGLDILIGRRGALGAVVMSLITVGALGGVLWLAGHEPAPAGAPGEAISGKIELPLGGAKSLTVKIDPDRMDVTLGAQPNPLGGADFAAQGDWSADAATQPDIAYTVEGDNGTLTISQPAGQPVFPFGLAVRSRMTLNLPRNIPLDIQVQDNLGSVSLDLTSLAARSLDARAKAGAISVTLPEAGQMQAVSVKGDLGSVSVTAPETATLNIATLDVSAGSGQLNLILPREGTIGALTVKGDLGSVTVGIAPDSTLQIGPADISSGSGSLSVSLPAQGALGKTTIQGDLGSLTVDIPGKHNSLTAESFSVRGGSGSVSVTLPARGTYQADIQGGLGSITVALPAGLEAHFDIASDLNAPQVSSARLKSVGDRAWETANYKQGDNRALVSIKAGSSGVTVEDQ